LAYNKDVFNQNQIDALKDIKSDFEYAGKTPSQRLYNVLYRYWQQDKKGYDVFEDYYRSQMEIIINHYKSKLL